jgi:glycosyltransferase involved in cell wall biosynthesis
MHHVPLLLVRHGTDLRRFTPREPETPRTDAVPLIVSVGRLVEKKGFDDLLAAIAVLRGRGYELRCRIYGDGPAREALEAQRDANGLTGCVEFAGACTQDDLARVYREANVFALTPFVADDGDRDGIPNAIVEAMASGLPVVTTDAGGITELVVDDVSGLVAVPRDIGMIASDIARLIDDPGLSDRLRQGALEAVADYDIDAAAAALVELFTVPETTP